MPETWSILKLLEWSTQYFQSKGIDSARLDAELLLAHVLGLSRVQLYIQFDSLLTASQLQHYKTLLKRRSQREPLAYLLGKKEFYSLEFIVTPAVLIPRPETELLVEKAIEHAKRCPIDASRLTILDAGTGSGCIAITLAKQLPQAHITAVDLSEKALELGLQNAKKYGVENQIEFLQIDFTLHASRDLLHKNFDFIVSNPPYIPQDEISKLAPELSFEPHEALVGGQDGLENYRTLIPWALTHLKKGAWLLLEIGQNQATPLRRLAQECGLQEIEMVPDLSGIERILKARHG